MRTSPRTFGNGRAFTLVELLAVVGVLGAGAAVVGSMQPDAPKGGGAAGPLDAAAASRASARQLKCATQVRGICQSLVVWAANNGDRYPLPSLLDVSNTTVKEAGREKDTTANIYSMLIWSGHIPTEMCVCPDEHWGSIKNDDKYEFADPKAALKPKEALWDPGFGVDFTRGARSPGNTSYAHLQPSGDMAPSEEKDKKGDAIKVPTGRWAMWSNTFSSSEAIVGDRGPEIESVAIDAGGDPDKYTVKTKLDKSVTFLNHGAPDSWEGNVCYNDNHTDFDTRLGPFKGHTLRTYETRGGLKRYDAIFFDEPEDPKSVNTFLGVFTTAGARPAQFKGIWD